jgi:hypothetical protein
VLLFSLDSEMNIPTAYATLLLLLASIILAVISLLKRKQVGSMVRCWSVLALGFLYMAVDEGWSMHEILIVPFRRWFRTEEIGIFYFAWVIPAIALVLVLGVLYLRFFLHLPRKTRLQFVSAAAVYLAGAIGFELIGSNYYYKHQVDFTYKMITTVEESLEMIGIILFIRALLEYLADTYGEVHFRFSNR